MKIRFDTSPVSGQQSNGLAVRYAAAKREVPRWRWALMLAVLGLPLAYLVWRFVVAAWWETAPGFVVVPTLTVKAAGTGTVRSVAAPGSIVERGAPLLTIAATAAPRAVAVPLAAPRRQGSAVLPPDAALALLNDAAALAERTLALRRERLDTVEALKRGAAATQAEADTARATLTQAAADVLRARVDVLARRRTLDDQARAAAGEQAVPAPLPAAGDNLAAAALSPFAGTVTAVMVAVGEYVTPTTEALLLQGREAPTIEAYVAPADARYARAGRNASLRFFDGLHVPAVVTEVAGQTARVPAERVGPLSPRTQAILVRLRPEQALPERYRINLLPLDVRFDTVWPWSD